MKGLKVLALIALFVWALPLFGTVDAFLKIEGWDTDQTYAGHEAWIRLASWSWKPPIQQVSSVNGLIASCATNEAKFAVNFPPISQTNPFPSQVQLGLLTMCTSHKQYPTMQVDLNGQHHVLQNASITSCQDSPGGQTYT